jgi:hypothetical protein
MAGKSKINLLNQRFGRLVVQAVDPSPPAVSTGKGGLFRPRSWLCDCDCGPNNFSVVTASLLKSPGTISCGCYKKEMASRLGKMACRKRYGETICPMCGKEFNRSACQKYCSLDCKEKAHRAPRVKRACAYCGDTIAQARSNQFYCGPSCKSRFRTQGHGPLTQIGIIQMRIEETDDEPQD